METKEAIKIINQYDMNFHWNDGAPIPVEQLADAFDLAISALEKQDAIKSCTPPSDDWEHYADRLHDIAYQSGYEQGKKDAEQDRWIPVTERLPETTDEVLTTYINNGNRKTVCRDSYILS